MIDRSLQTKTLFDLVHIFINKVVFWGIIFLSGCSYLPINVAEKSAKIISGSPENAERTPVADEKSQIETGENRSNPFDMNLNDQALKQSELDSALRRLVKDLEQAMMNASEGVASNNDGTYLIKRGDYLDKIIRTTVGNYPFKRDILRKAFVQANPKVFRRSNPNWMYANKTMRIPQVEDIKRVIFKDQPQQKLSSGNPYDGWVRYP